MHAVGVIPARYQSSRFPGKPLALIDGRTLVERVFERARSAGRIARLLVATDDERIASAVRAFGGEVAMTSPTHASGTDRLAEVARSLSADVFVNIQGDEPLLDPRDIDGLVECLDSDPSSDMATLADPLLDAEEARDSNVVKVVCDASGRALYFSRSPIPYVLAREGRAGRAPADVADLPDAAVAERSRPVRVPARVPARVRLLESRRFGRARRAGAAPHARAGPHDQGPEGARTLSRGRHPRRRPRGGAGASDVLMRC